MANVNPKFVLKTDDDAYVDTGHMVTALRELCQNPNCSDERYAHLSFNCIPSSPSESRGLQICRNPWSLEP